MRKTIKLASPSFGPEEIRAATAVMRSGWIVHGPKNKEFEGLIAEALGAKHCVAVNSGASALHLALLACGVTSGEVIIPSFTMSATANAVVTAGCVPVFADVDSKTGNIDPEDVRRRVTKRTRAIMPVHLAGQPCDMTALMDVAGRRKIPVIEDAAETIGGKWRGKCAGTFGRAGCLSFWASKAITTGEGGAVVTDDADIAKAVRALSAHGIATTTAQRQKATRPWRRDAVMAGYNFRLSHIAAAIGAEQAKKLSRLNEARRRHASRLKKLLTDVEGLRPLAESPEAEHVYQMFIVTVPARVRDRLVLALRGRGVEASVHFDPPVHEQTFYRKRFGKVKLPATEKLAKTVVTLPLYPLMTAGEVAFVASSTREALRELL